jgi:transposase
MTEGRPGGDREAGQVDKDARGSRHDRRAELRKMHATLVFHDMDRWLTMQRTTISDKSPQAGTIRYALIRRERLRPYLDHGIPGLDNDAAQRGMFAVAFRRKNYPLSDPK